jgi:hypothetical protein
MVSPSRSTRTNRSVSRRTALRAGVAGAAATVATAGPRAVAAQEATPTAPAGWRTEHLEVHVVVADPVNITRAGSGPPQRGDYFYIDGPIYAADDIDGTQIGQYNCFGAWTTAADNREAPYQRLTTVQHLLDDGSIMGLINEAGSDPDIKVGAIQGGTGRYTGALGTFRQFPEQGTSPGVVTPETTPAEAGTPAPARTVFRTVFELMLPAQG